MIIFLLQTHTWSFKPKDKDKYVMKPSLIVWGQGFSSSSSGGKKKEFTVRAIGEGTIGDIKVFCCFIYSVVNLSKKVSIVID